LYSEQEIKRYTKVLARLGVTKEDEVKAVLDYIHFAVCTAIKELKLKNNEGSLG
jgi:hypothetical protein